MTYADDEQARNEAASKPATDEAVERLRGAAARKAGELGSDGVRSHAIRFSASSWEGLLGGLPSQVRESGVITRGDVFDVAERVRTGEGTEVDLFTASFLWGTGTTGYGAARYRQIVDAAGDRLEPSLSAALGAAGALGDSPDPGAGYAALYGGYDHRRRARPGDGGTARIHKFGPAFFTKFLYFSTPGALILDIVLAGAVKRMSGLPHFLDDKGRAEPWTPYRYAVYLHWMNQTALATGTTADMLEMTLFAPPADDAGDEGPNAD